VRWWNKFQTPAILRRIYIRSGKLIYEQLFLHSLRSRLIVVRGEVIANSYQKLTSIFFNELENRYFLAHFSVNFKNSNLTQHRPDLFRIILNQNFRVNWDIDTLLQSSYSIYFPRFTLLQTNTDWTICLLFLSQWKYMTLFFPSPFA